jgi:hypothetical protein
MRGAESVTVTDSVVSPTSRLKSILATWSTSNWMAVRVIDLNPAIVTFMVYVPGVRNGNT